MMKTLLNKAMVFFFLSFLVTPLVTNQDFLRHLRTDGNNGTTKVVNSL